MCPLAMPNHATLLFGVHNVIKSEQKNLSIADWVFHSLTLRETASCPTIGVRTVVRTWISILYSNFATIEEYTHWGLGASPSPGSKLTLRIQPTYDLLTLEERYVESKESMEEERQSLVFSGRGTATSS